MDLDVYFTFVFASLSYVIPPGPVMVLGMNYGANYGVKKTVFLILGSLSGSVIYAVLSVFGFGVLLAHYPQIGQYVRITGAFVIAFMALKIILTTLRSNKNPQFFKPPYKSNFAVYRDGFLVNVTSPLQFVFYGTIMPAFIDVQAPNFLLQYLILCSTHFTFIFVLAVSYGAFAKKLFEKLAKKGKMHYFNFASAGMLLVLAILLACSLFV